MTDILQIECADGKQLPYDGYFTVNLTITHGLPQATTRSCLFLITPDTKYSERTPIIIGTNILNIFYEECRQNFGEQYLQKVDLHIPWYLSFRCLTLREKELKKNKNRIAIVRSAEKQKIILGPNESKNIVGQKDPLCDYGNTYALFHESEYASLPHYADIATSLLNLDSGKRNTLTVNISNLTMNTIVISPKSILCELQPVSIEEKQIEDLAKEMDKQEVLNLINMDTNRVLDMHQRSRLTSLLHQHIDIFFKGR